jgi:hypothetical protein
MKPPPNNPEFAKFTDALRKIVRVPKQEVETKMDAAKQERERQRKQTSVRASRDKDSPAKD